MNIKVGIDMSLCSNRYLQFLKNREFIGHCLIIWTVLDNVVQPSSYYIYILLLVLYD